MYSNEIHGWDSLHPKQQKLYELLVKLRHDELITLDDMREALGANSLNTAVHHLKQMERKGYIRKNTLTGRIETLAQPLQDIVYLNLYGSAGCGPSGFFAEENVQERIPFPAKQLRVNPNAFLVRARNDSMEPMIHDHDLVVIEPRPVASNGDVTLVVHQDEAKLKQFFREGSQIVLQSLNSRYRPIVACVDDEDVSLVGIVRGVVRSFADNDLKIQKSRYQ